jgi:hypothetical protein
MGLDAKRKSALQATEFKANDPAVNGEESI